MAPLTSEAQKRPTETQSVPSSSKETEGDLAALREQQQQQPASKTAPSEMSWMSLAMEKTKSLQQLLTGRFSRDYTGTQAAARPQSQGQTTSQSGEQTPAKSPEAVSPPSRDALKAAQTTQPPSASSAQTECSAQSAQGSVTQSLAHFYLSTGQQQQQQQQQPPWAWRSHVSNKSSTSAPLGVLDAPLGTSPSVVRSESQVSVPKKEGLPPSGKRLLWTGLVSEKAASLERQSGRTSPPGSKGVSNCTTK